MHSNANDFALLLGRDHQLRVQTDDVCKRVLERSEEGSHCGFEFVPLPFQAISVRIAMSLQGMKDRACRFFFRCDGVQCGELRIDLANRPAALEVSDGTLGGVASRRWAV